MLLISFSFLNALVWQHKKKPYSRKRNLKNRRWSKESVTLTRDHRDLWFLSSLFNFFFFFPLPRAFMLLRSLDLNIFLIHFLLFPCLSHHLWELVQDRWSPVWPSQHGVPRISLCWYGMPSLFPSLGGKSSLGKAFLVAVRGRVWRKSQGQPQSPVRLGHYGKVLPWELRTDTR